MRIIEAFEGFYSDAGLRELYLDGADIIWYKNENHPTPQEEERRSFIEIGYRTDALGMHKEYVSDQEWKRQDPEGYERVSNLFKDRKLKRKRKWEIA